MQCGYPLAVITDHYVAVGPWTHILLTVPYSRGFNRVAIGRQW